MPADHVSTGFVATNCWLKDLREQTWLWGMWGQTWRAHRLAWIHRPVHRSGCKRSVTKDWSFVDEQNPEINSEGHRWNRCNMTLSACEEPSCSISYKLKTGQSKLQKSEWEEWPSPNLSQKYHSETFAMRLDRKTLWWNQVGQSNNDK